MQDENSREMDEAVTDKAAVTDKKERAMKIALKVVYIAAAVLSLLTLVLMFVGTQAIITFAGVSWLSAICMGLLPASALALAAAALINLKKETPRLLMFFAGASAATGIYLTTLSWALGLLMAAAGVAVMIVEGMKQARIYQDAPTARTKGKTLVIAGVLAILMALLSGVCTLLAAATLAGLFGRSDLSTAYFFSGLFCVAGLVALGMFCFIKRRKTSVFYRMFFLGGVVVMAVQIMVNLVSVFQQAGYMMEMYYGAGYGSAYYMWGNLYMLANAAVLVILVLVLFHAIRTRKAAAIADDGDAEAAEEEEEEGGEIDETIGLYKEEDDEIDETIGLYKEEDEAEKPAGDESPKDDK